ncbi:MAG TPA: hypothetical protein G4O04_05115 [Anaerolineae bacterium]|nr:hypothetical protein [Anaerolineae bacterium]
MKAPWLWMLLPGLLGLVLLVWRPPTRQGAWWAGALGFVLLSVASVVPIEAAVLWGRWAFRLDASMVVLGRQFVLPDAARPWLIMLYAGLVLWMAGAYAARAPAYAPGLALMTIALGVGALAVRPPLYAVLLMAMAAWGSLPLLVHREAPQARGAVRWLAFQTLAVPLLLYAGWLLSLNQGGGATPLSLRAVGLLGLGVALLLALFPFHSPISLLSEETSPHALVWIVLLTTGVVGTWAMGFLYGLPWVREARVLLWLRTVGVLMWALGGLMAPFQRHAGRMLGYAVLAEAGMMLVALSLPAQEGVPLFFLLWVVRLVALALWGTGLARLRIVGGGLAFRGLLGLGRAYPLASVSVVVAALTLAGVPWLPGFPTRMALWEALARTSLWALGGALLGTGGLVGGAFRLVGGLFTGAGEQETPTERKFAWGDVFPLGMTLFLVVLGGLLPDLWVVPLIEIVQRLWLQSPGP